MKAPLTLRTARLTLEPLGEGDAPALGHLFNHPEVGRFLWDGQPVPAATVAAVVAASERSFAGYGYGLYTLRHVDGTTIGMAGLRPDAEQRPELLYALEPRHWGRGFATEAARAVVELDVDGRRERRWRLLAPAQRAPS